MHLIPDSSSIVLAGIWNPAILTPEWIARRLLDVPAGEAIELQIEQVLNVLAQAPTFMLRGIKFTPGRNRVVIRPTMNTAANYAATQRAAARVLQTLPHTPLVGVGQNFEFQEDHPTEPQLAVFGAVSDLAARCDFEFETVATSLMSSIKFEGRLLNLTRVSTTGQLQLKFNFHYQASTAEAAGQVLADEEVFWQNMQYALRIIRTVYEEEIDITQPAPPPAAAVVAANNP